MIALAVADRPLTRKLLLEGRLTIDYLETSGPLAEGIKKILPGQAFLLHNSVWNWSLAHPAALEQRDVLTKTLNRLQELGVPWLSVHLGFSAAEVSFDEVMRPRTAPLPCEALLETICGNLHALAAHIKLPLLVENLDYNPGGAYECVCEPDFIAAVLEQTDVGFLLDLAHARVSAAQLGMHIADYLAKLPLQATRQIHVSGPRWQAGILIDAHDTLLDEDYELLEEVLTRSQPWALTLEYDRDTASLIRQLHNLRQILVRASVNNS